MDGPSPSLSRTIVATEPSATGHGVSEREAFWVWLRIALLSFGGPAGQIAVMQRALVDVRAGACVTARTGSRMVARRRRCG